MSFWIKMLALNNAILSNKENENSLCVLHRLSTYEL